MYLPVMLPQSGNNPDVLQLKNEKWCKTDSDRTKKTISKLERRPDMQQYDKL